jgi:chromosomal replication initiation ATPase DnaA
MINKIRNEVEQATMQDLSSRRRQRELVYARAIYFKLCKEKTTSTLKRDCWHTRCKPRYSFACY